MNAIGWRPGAKITEPGIYPSIPLPIYHGDLCDGVSASHSSLERIFTKSPLHFWDKFYGNPDHEPDDPTQAMNLGRASHHLFLGERNFQKEYIRRPERYLGEKWQGNRTVCKDWVADKQKAGLTILTPEQIDSIARMKVALEHEPMIKAGLLSGRIEQSFIWIDAETGIWMKARPDAVPSDGDFADLKVVADISEEGLERSIAEYGYHRQGALILEGASKLMGLPLKFRGPGEGEGMSHSLVFVESKRPHAVEIVTLRPPDLQRGMDENRAARRLLRRCLDADHWPGPSGEQKDARYLGLSPWRAERNAYRVKQIEAMLAIPAPERTGEQA